MRLLVMDHFSGQDIDALRAVAGESVRIDVMPYAEMRNAALRVMSPDVASGLEAFTRPENAEGRRRHAGVVRQILRDRFTFSPFDALVMPSDTFFYVRAAPAAAHELGVPFIVAQKETTISEHTMRMHAESVRRHAPPLADLMTVCSERHKEFWIRAGGDPGRIVVTGQPRFDFYLMPQQWPTRPRSDPPTVLFLSYQADAYHPSEGAAGDVWNELHRQTEAGLHVLAQRGWRVLIKPHPQQSHGDVQAWRTRAGVLWGKQIQLVDADADVRALIVTSDVTVGFQTTALLEAMLAGRPAAYTGWDERALAIGPDLIPFHEWDDALAVVRSPEALADTVDGLRGKEFDGEALQRRRAIAEHYLGPLDGHASDRTLRLIRQATTTWTERRSPEQLVLRERLCARSRPVALSMRGRAGLRIARRRVGALLSR